MSDEFRDIVLQIQRDHRDVVTLSPTTVWTYIHDGGTMLSLPIAKSLPNKGFKRPRWLPVTFDWTGPRPCLQDVREEVFRCVEEKVTNAAGNGQ